MIYLMNLTVAQAKGMERNDHGIIWENIPEGFVG
jgi:hypothetical protein